MSTQKYDWWGYVKGMIRRYPSLCRMRQDMLEQGVTVSYDAIGHGTATPRTVENIALRELPTTNEREYWAVTKAIETTRKQPNGSSRLKVIDLVFWRRSHTLGGAARAAYLSLRSAQRYHTEFIRLVASYYGLLDE